MVVDAHRLFIAAVTSCSLVTLAACGGPASPLHGSATTVTPTSKVIYAHTKVRGQLLVPGNDSPAYHMLTPGTVVSSGDLFQTTQNQGQEVFVDHLHGYGLAFIQSQTYPVTTADGGITWRVDGPIFYVAAADADQYVDQITAPSAQTILVWGPSSANVVDVTTDAGLTWWSANLGPGVLGMGETETTPDRLWAVVADPIARFFISADGGRTWSFSHTIR
jgi:BNR/Asp-box repeat protein